MKIITLSYKAKFLVVSYLVRPSNENLGEFSSDSALKDKISANNEQKSR